MSNQTCYVEFDFVAFHFALPFTERWKRKVKNLRKKKDPKVYAFDKFISLYIIYAALVNVIKSIEYKNKHDREYCTSLMSEYILNHTEDKEKFLHRLSNPVEDLIKASRHFTIISSRNESPNLKDSWTSGDYSQRLNALFITLYDMRCNLFASST